MGEEYLYIHRKCKQPNGSFVGGFNDSKGNIISRHFNKKIKNTYTKTYNPRLVIINKQHEIEGELIYIKYL